MSSTQIARFVISFSWIYHGLFPKLMHIDPIEKLMTASMGFSDEISYFITKSAGVGEVAFGLILFVFYKSKAVVLLNIVALSGLLLFVAAFQPQMLMAAFNPVTTNIPIIALSFILLNESKQSK